MFPPPWTDNKIAATQEGRGEWKEAVAVFRHFDVDSSGTIDGDEFASLLNQVFPERCEENEAWIAQQFAGIDVNGDTCISLDEFYKYCALATHSHCNSLDLLRPLLLPCPRAVPCS